MGLCKMVALARFSLLLIEQERAPRELQEGLSRYADLMSDIIDYAEVMDMLALSCDAVRVRAELTIRRGDTG